MGLFCIALCCSQINANILYHIINRLCCHHILEQSSLAICLFYARSGMPLADISSFCCHTFSNQCRVFKPTCPAIICSFSNLALGVSKWPKLEHCSCWKGLQISMSVPKKCRHWRPSHSANKWCEANIFTGGVLKLNIFFFFFFSNSFGLLVQYQNCGFKKQLFQKMT